MFTDWGCIFSVEEELSDPEDQDEPEGDGRGDRVQEADRDSVIDPDVWKKSFCLARLALKVLHKTLNELAFLMFIAWSRLQKEIRLEIKLIIILLTLISFFVKFALFVYLLCSLKCCFEC